MSKLDKIIDIVEPIVARHGCELVLATFQRERPGWVLRLLIERTGLGTDDGSGVDHQLCASVSRDAGATLEVEDLIDEAYSLEVSSPGVERPLVKEADYERFIGRLIKLKMNRSFEGSGKLKGTITGVEPGKINLDTGNGESVVLPFEAIKKANLVYSPQRAKANAGEK